MLWRRLRSKAESQYRLQDAMHVAMGVLGWLLPDTETVVKATSTEDEDLTAKLPDELKDPFVILDRDRHDATQDRS